MLIFCVWSKTSNISKYFLAMISRYLTLSRIPVNQMTLFSEIQTLIVYLAKVVDSDLPSVSESGSN